MLFDYSTPLRVTASWALGHPSWLREFIGVPLSLNSLTAEPNKEETKCFLDQHKYK
jgi:hypothetical protein